MTNDSTHDPSAGETLLVFPCRFALKAFGRDRSTFEDTVYRLVKPHVPELSARDLKTRESRNGRYLAVTATITAQSKAQLDAIYTDLSADPAVIMSL